VGVVPPPSPLPTLLPFSAGRGQEGGGGGEVGGGAEVEGVVVALVAGVRLRRGRPAGWGSDR